MRRNELAVDAGRPSSTELRACAAARKLALDTCTRCGSSGVTIVGDVALCAPCAAHVRVDRQIQRQRETVAAMRAARRTA